jgi:hypothetical protein
VALIGYLIPLRAPTTRTGGDQVVGVLTVDLSIEQFFKSKKLKGWMNALELGHEGQTSYGFVISHTKKTWDGGSGKGAFISHPGPAPEYHYPRTITQLGGADPKFAALVDRMLTGEPGRGSAIDPWTGKRSTFLFAPVPSAEWTFVAVIQEAAEAPPP